MCVCVYVLKMQNILNLMTKYRNRIHLLMIDIIYIYTQITICVYNKLLYYEERIYKYSKSLKPQTNIRKENKWGGIE